MKIRHDFVSNSSSSSFIIEATETSYIHQQGLSKQDFVDAIYDLMGGKTKIDAEAAAHKSKWWDGMPFHVYDKHDPNDMKVIKEMTYLKQWISPRVYRNADDGSLSRSGATMRYNDFSSAYEAMRSTYNTPDLCELLDNEGPIKTSTYDYANRKYITGLLPDYVRQVIMDIVEHYGIMTNYDVLQHDVSRFILKFGDNDVYDMKGMVDDSDSEVEKALEADPSSGAVKMGFATESYSDDRVCEVLHKWFVGHNRLKHPELNPTWEDLSRCFLAVVMHEG